MDNYVGKRLDGRYEVQEIIGVGGMSVVYKAYDNVDDKIVAVKILKKEFLNNEEFKRRFKNESKAISLLSHPNIVKVLDVNFGDKLMYIVMEHIDGITLKEYVHKRGAITWNDALFFMTQILKAVQHAHDKGIVHRDIKSQNILVISNGEIKVTDFGIARFSRNHTQTLTEEAIGSVHYIAPEQAKGEITDEKADLYSIGIVFYEMLSGQVPFDSDSAVSVALMQINDMPKRLADLNPDIPLGIEQVCFHALQKEITNRYQTATEMLLDIEQLIKNPLYVFNYENDFKEIKEKKIPSIDISSDKDEEYVVDDVLTEEDDAFLKKQKKKRIIAGLIGFIVLLAAIATLITQVTKNLNTSSNTLDNFVGQSYDDIQDNEDLDFKFVAKYEKTDQYESGYVISQSPEAGSKVIKGSTVTLTVAMTESDINVPKVYEYTLEKAKEALTRAGLSNFKTVEVNSETIEEGRVVSTKPRANAVAAKDDQIVIYISSGPSTTVINTYTVPDLTGLSKKDASNFLKQYGFKNFEFKTEDSEKKEGTVISQIPSAGIKAKENEKIVITLSAGHTTTIAKLNVSIVFPLVTKDGEEQKSTYSIMIDGKMIDGGSVVLNGKTVKKNISVEADASEVTVTIGDNESTRSIVNNKVSFDFSEFSSEE